MLKSHYTNYLHVVSSTSNSKQNELLLSDVWTSEALGLKTCPGSSESKLYFYRIQPAWFKELTKKYIFYRASSVEFTTICGFLKTLKSFGKFLFDYFPEITNANQINEQLILDYYLNLKQKNYKPGHIKRNLVQLKVFFDVGNDLCWFEISHELLKDWIGATHKAIKTLPRFIPDDVMKQLNQHLKALPEPLQRMVLVIQECGLRVSELVSLKLDCLQQDSTGGWFIKFIRWKMKKEDIIPISNELAGVMKKQQNYINSCFPEKYTYLFCCSEQYFKNQDVADFKPVAKLMLSQTFNNYLNWLAIKFEICDSSKNIWHFQSHQFRHSVATKMINNNVPHHIIQRYLGHTSPTMTSIYAHLMDSTLKKEINNYHDKVVNVTGEIIKSEFTELDNNTELQWMRKKVLGEVLSNGYCALPTNLNCSKGNACLQCGDFRTTREFLDQHKQHLLRTQSALELADKNNWQRQVQVNEEVLSNLNKIINELEKDS
jgi:integrase